MYILMALSQKGLLTPFHSFTAELFHYCRRGGRYFGSLQPERGPKRNSNLGEEPNLRDFLRQPTHGTLQVPGNTVASLGGASRKGESVQLHGRFFQVIGIVWS